MSTTFTLPISAGDHFDHGQKQTQSNSRSHQRHRTGTRLSPPFALPRIPSETLTQTHSHDHEHHNEHEHEHEVAQTHNHDHDHDHDHDHSHSHSHGHGHEHSHGHDHHHSCDHNNIATHTNGFISAPRFDLDGPMVTKKRSFYAATAESPSAVTSFTPQHQHRHVSRPTEMLLRSTENYSLLHGILADHDSRRIFYFMILNLAFMGVQSTYGFLTGSLGLISDSIHMFFDCVALLVGVCAAVMSKWPPSAKFPYGYGKLDTLAGLGNGIFLMLISIEIVYEAIERLFNGADISRTTELLVVSTAGLLVNMVGIFAFHGAHGHHGHAHGHDQSHAHHGHDHAEHNHLRRPSTAASSSPAKAQKANAHGHHHGTENMEGIYLHIMADALGSVAVVLSTLLVQFTGWSGFDPLASCIIAVLIFASTVPLVSSTTKILLLSLNSDIEYNLRDILGGLTAIKGVVSYTAPKFWLEDVKKDTSHDHHHHAHGHGHDHGHHHHSHKSSEDLDSASDNDPAVLGVMHIIVAQRAEVADVKAKVSQYFQARKMDIVVQYEREGESKCWCCAGMKSN